MAETPIIDRTIDRMKIKSTLDEQARAKGFADYTAEPTLTMRRGANVPATL